MTRVGVYDEILPEPSSRHNTVTIRVVYSNNAGLILFIGKFSVLCCGYYIEDILALVAVFPEDYVNAALC